MSTFFELDLLLLIIAVTVNSALALFVYRNNPRSATNKVYASLGFIMSFWLVANFVSFQTKFIDYSLWLIRISLFLATPLNTLFFILARTVPKQELGLSKWGVTILLAATFLIMALTLSPVVFSDVQVVNNSLSPIPGPGIAVFGIFSIVLNMLAIFTLVRRFLKATGEERQQLKIIMLGVLIMFGGVIFTVFLPTVLFNSSLFVPLLPLYALIFLGMTAYTIVTYHLFNLRIIATEALTFTIWIILGARIFTKVNFKEQILDSLILAAMVVFGILLMKSVRKEVEQRKRLEVLTQDLEAANEKLKELDHLKSEFLSFASHQIKAPLAAIKGFATLISDGTYGEVSDKVKDAAIKIKDSVDRMIQLVSDSLNLRKIEEGRMEYKLERVNAVKVVEEIFEELKLLAEKKKLEFTIESHPGGGWINADPQNIRQVFQNLIENAIKYTDAGFVKVRTESYAGQFTFSVSDSGHGISKELLPHLFEEFRRDTKEKRIEGTGLGLYIAHEIATAHNGEIWAESDGQGKGSKFIVKFPLA